MVTLSEIFAIQDMTCVLMLLSLIILPMLVSSNLSLLVPSFLGTFVLFLAIFLQNGLVHFSTRLFVVFLIVFIIGVSKALQAMFPNRKDYQIATRGAGLGYLFALGVYLQLMSASSAIAVFGTYMAVATLFYYSECLLFCSLHSPEDLDRSFLVHRNYIFRFAALISIMEFYIESYYFPDLKELTWISNIGLYICVLAEMLRVAAIVTADSDFLPMTHCSEVAPKRLVNNGIYSLLRHPGYVGWYYWLIGTQILLINPISVICYAIGYWWFFCKCIRNDEAKLVKGLKEEYVNYQKTVTNGMPFYEAIFEK